MTMRIYKEEGDFRGIGLSQGCHTCLHKQEQVIRRENWD